MRIKYYIAKLLWSYFRRYCEVEGWKDPADNMPSFRILMFGEEMEGIEYYQDEFITFKR